MGDNSLGKLVKELQKLTVHSANPPEKLTRETNFARLEVRCKDYLQDLDAMAHRGATMALLDDEFYDLALLTDISAATAPSAILDGLREILGSSENPWVLQADFHRRCQQPGESINDLQQALRLLRRRAFPTLEAKALSTRVLEQLVAGFHDPQIRKILLRDRPQTHEKALALAQEEEVLQAACEQPSRSLFGVTAIRKILLRDRPQTLEKALALAQEEEVLKAACEQPSRSLFGVTAVHPHFSRDASTQSPRPDCSRGYSPRPRNWRRPQTQRPPRPQARHTIDAIDAGPEPIDGEYIIVPDTVISCLGSTNRPLVRRTVGNTSLSCLVDSGAGCSLVRQQPFLKFQTKIRYCDRSNLTLHTAKCANLRHTGLVEFSLDLAGFSLTRKFIVSPDITWDCIIGVDFLNKFKCSVDFSRHLLHTASVKVPFLPRIPRPAR
ncbi:unnamed protein product [Schistocephalus solidus]|uniref:RVP domain-containing protein n=1 Tax=Schistocephalus solidus TaxID=70667 RepID=A0A183TEM8_SCHSO|nr:unnamed protein product [Schistocephalus solidus]